MPSADPKSAVRRKVITPIKEFLKTESAGSIFLVVATAIALVWANSALSDGYFDFWHHELEIGVGPLAVTESLQHWVNDGLMTLFFFVVALEIKRELVLGELKNPRTAALPVALAIGGMVVPALLYVGLTAGTELSRGWAIPMATDIAFALAALGLVSKKVPTGSRLILLSLAIVDDLGAILVIALFYSAGVKVSWMVGILGAVGVVLLMRRARLTSPLWYLLPGVVLWYCTLRSGVHPTLAGVALGLLTPAGKFHGRRALEELEHLFHPIAAFFVLPIFALANAGVVLGGEAFGEALTSRVTWAVIIGLFIGKPLGIMLAGFISLRFKMADLPKGMKLMDLLPVSIVAGVGFTVALFIAGLSFTGITLEHAKSGILLGSAAAVIAGAISLLVRPDTPAPANEE